jgi:hypothetical protein
MEEAIHHHNYAWKRVFKVDGPVKYDFALVGLGVYEKF